MNKYNIVFESQNLYYVNLDKTLVNEYLKMVNDPEVQRGISHKLRKFTYEQELEWVKMKIAENAAIYTIIEKSTNDFVGNVEIMHIRDGVGEIGISITRDKQKKHYGQEAMNAIIRYGYNYLNIQGFDLNVYKTNSHAIHCYEKIGFVPVGIGKTEEDIHMVYNELKLIPYNDIDYDFVYDVKKNAYKKYVEECWGSWNDEIQKELFEKFINAVKDDAYIINYKGNNIGFYNGETLEDGSYEIGNICIIPEYQGKGFGTKILKDVMKIHKNQDLHIQYFKQNPVGKLYEKLGFVPNYEKEFHYVMFKEKEKELKK